MSYRGAGTAKGPLYFQAVVSPGLSIASEGRIFFDSGSNTFQVSQNGGAYSALATVAMVGWTDDGTVVRLTSAIDGVGIGVAAIAASSKFEVLGDATRTNVLVTGGPAGAITLVGGQGGAGGAVIFQTGVGAATERGRWQPSGTLEFTGISADPAVSAANNGSLFFNSTTDTFRASENGVVYGDVVVERTATVTTNGAAVTTLASATLADNTVYYVYAYIVARRTDAAARAVYVREVAAFREAAGAATLEGVVATPFTRESVAAYDATIDVSGNDVRVRVTGVAGNAINWKVWLRLVPVA